MKILHLADLHLQHEWFDWVSSQSRDYELLVIAGDLQNAFSGTGMHDQARAVSKWLLSLTTPTVVCSGNHDYWVSDPRVFFDVAAEARWIRDLRGKGSIVGVDGDAVEFRGLRIFVNGWLQEPDAGPFDIVVTHAPPEACACAGADGRDHGDSCLLNALQSQPPTLLLCGHVHAPAKLSCKWPPLYPTCTVLVPGCDEQSEVPAHWIINTDHGVAIHSAGVVQSFDKPIGGPRR